MPAADPSAGTAGGGAGVRATCAHCGLPAAARGTDVVYCCVGCRLAAAAGGGGGPRGFLEARLLLAAFLAMGVMEFTLVLYGDSLFEARADGARHGVRALGLVALVVFSFPVLLLLAPPILRGAWQDLRAGAVRTDGLVAITIVACWGLSAWHAWRGAGEVYFETATMLLVLFAFGRRLEAHARAHGRDAARELAQCLPAKAHRIAARTDDACAAPGPADAGPVGHATVGHGTVGLGTTEDVAPDVLRAGDRVRVLPGESCPADVVVLEGRSDVAAAHVTGEEAPRPVGVGDRVPSGAVNGSGLLVARVERPASEGTLGRILALLDAPLPSTRTLRLTDRWAGALTAVAVVLAVAGGLRSAASDGAGAGLRTALAVLVVACPCALGLATPLAYRAMRAALARRGVLVLDPAALEVAADVDRALLDKTGTLTDPAGRRAQLAAGDPAAFARMQALVASSGHALAAAVAPGGAVAHLRTVAGAGVAGETDGVAGRAGSPEWMDREGWTWDPDVAAARVALSATGSTLIAHGEGGRVRALAVVPQALRRGAREAVSRLTELGVRAEIASGDHAAAVGTVARDLGIEGAGSLRPEDKVRRIEDLRATGATVLVAGDGVNDAPALRAADVGVAMACGTAAARSQAQVEVLGDDLAALPRLVEASRELRRVVRGNLAWNVAYNAAALGFAALGHLHPLLAVAGMIASSLTVSVRSYRLLDWRPASAGPSRTGADRAASPVPGWAA